MKSKEDRIKFLEMFTGMCEYYDKKYSEALLTIYYEALKQYEVEDILNAAKKIIQTRKYNSLPMAADFIEHITGGLKGVAHQQVLEVLDRFKSGDYNTPFNDPVTQKLMTTRWPLWRWAPTVLETEIKWFTKEFIEAYESLEPVKDQILLDLNKPPTELLEVLTRHIGDES